MPTIQAEAHQVGTGGLDNASEALFYITHFFLQQNLLPNISPVEDLQLIKWHSYWFTERN